LHNKLKEKEYRMFKIKVTGTWELTPSKVKEALVLLKALEGLDSEIRERKDLMIQGGNKETTKNATK
jgi:hypothetical protein